VTAGSSQHSAAVANFHSSNYNPLADFEGQRAVGKVFAVGKV
jgi:hypothetical protein